MEALGYLILAVLALGATIGFVGAAVARWAAPRFGAATAGYRVKPSTRRNYAQRN